MTDSFHRSPSFHLPGDPLDLCVQPEPLPASGLSLERTQGLGQFFDTAGHRTLVMGEEGGDSEVWVYPFKAAHQIRFSWEVDGKQTPLADGRSAFEVRPEASRTVYRWANLTVEQVILTPIGHPAAIYAFDITAASPMTLRASLRSDVKMMWPAEGIPQSPEYGVDDRTGAWVVRATASKDAVVAGWAGGRIAGGDADDPSLLEHTIDIPAGEGPCRVLFIVAGSVDGAEAARGAFVTAASDYDRLYSEAVSYYRGLLDGATQLESSDAALDEAFKWAVVGIDKCFMHTPALGAGFIAGYDLSKEGARPGFGWYFGRDSSWTGFAASDYGDFGKVRDNIRLLAKHQIKDGPNKGKIYHELSAADDRMPAHDYAFPAGDSTPFFVADLANYYQWTADKVFVQEMWPHALAAMDWCARMDVDGDLLIDNPPAGHQWYDGGEKNMVDLVAIWAMALRGAAMLGEALGDFRADAWREQADGVVRILNTEFWNAGDGYLFDRKLPDGSMHTLTTGNPPVPLLWKLIEARKAGHAIARMAKDDLTVDWGLRTNSTLDPIYVSTGYHEGTVWPLTTGWGSLAAFANGRPDMGWKYLKANTDLTRDWCLGYITEVLEGDRRVPSGCPHQAWSEAMVVMPVVEGLFGVQPDWPSRKVVLNPSLPADLGWAKLSNLAVGEARLNIETRQEAGEMRVSVDVSGSDIALEVGALVPEGKSLQSCAVDGVDVPAGGYRLEPEGAGMRIIVGVSPRARVRVSFKWAAE